MGFINKKNEKMVNEIARVVCAWWVAVLTQKQKSNNKNATKFISPGQKENFSSVFENLLKEFLKIELDFSNSTCYKEKLLFINNFEKTDVLLLAALESAHLDKSVLPRNCFSIVNLDENNSKITNFDNNNNLQEVIISKNLLIN